MSLRLFLSSAWDDGTQRVNTRFGWHGQRIGRGSYRESRGGEDRNEACPAFGAAGDFSGGH